MVMLYHDPLSDSFCHTTARMLPERNSLTGLFFAGADLDLVAVAILLFPFVRDESDPLVTSKPKSQFIEQGNR